MIFKCKMCGGTLEVNTGTSVAECPYCGAKQTLPKLDDERRANLYDRAGHFRRMSDFDKAMALYEQILNEDTTDAEAYWSIVLCRYGIEYVEDPMTHKRIPTVNRVQRTSVLADEDYKSALTYADEYQRELYEAEAKEIEEIQKGILSISEREEPFDVFICYKETDNRGVRTRDSVLANELYYELTKEGYKVFFSRITLEDKLGTAYEPYIFAALQSARVMVVVGTKAENFNAPWVKNEWSRYLALIRSGAKKTLIPAYRDMDPYDLPDAFSHLQAQDMSKLGFMQDLTRGIKKLLADDTGKIAAEHSTATVNTSNANTTSPLLERAFLFLEDGRWKEADAYCEKVLDQDPKNGRAYLGKLLAAMEIRRTEELNDYTWFSYHNDPNYQKAIRFDSGIAKQLAEYRDAELAQEYRVAVQEQTDAKDSRQCFAAAEHFEKLGDFQDAPARAEACRTRAKQLEQEELLKQTWLFLKNGDFASADTYCKKILDANTECSEAYFLKLLTQMKCRNIKQLLQCLYPIDSNPNYQKAVSYATPEQRAVLDGYAQTIRHKIAAHRAEEAEKARRKKKNRRIAAIVTGVVIFLAVLTFTIVLLSTPVTKNGITYKKDGDGYTVIAAANAEKVSDCVIQSKIRGKEVTAIAESAFENNTYLTSIRIPASVTRIGNAAFANCTSLSSVALESDDGQARTRTIGTNAFRNCTSLHAITVPDSFKIVDDYAFFGCTSLTTVRLGRGLTRIGQNAFENCLALNWVEFTQQSGWYLTHFINDKTGTYILLSNEVKNAENLRSIYCGYYWKRP